MLSCQEVVHLASQVLEAPLTRRQRWGMRLHLLFCRLCRGYLAHLRFLERAFERARDDNSECFSPRERLPKQARERIRRALQDKDPS